MLYNIFHDAMLPLVCAGFCLVVSDQEVPGVSNVHISQDGVVTWDVQSNTSVSLPLRFRVKVVGEGQRTGYYRTVNVSANFYNLMALSLSPGDYSIQIQVLSQNGLSAGMYSIPETYAIKGTDYKRVNLVDVILPVVVGTGLFLGILLLMFTMKSRSGLFACYQVSHSSKKKNTKQCVLVTQQATPVGFVNNDAYQHTYQSERDHEGFHRRAENITSGMGNQNEYSYANCSTPPLPVESPPYLYATENIIDTTASSRMEHHIVDGMVGEYVNMEAENIMVAALPVIPLTQPQNSPEAQDNEYIEVFHKSGTLV